MFNPPGKRAFGFHNAYQSQTQNRPLKRQLRNIHQRLRILLRLLAHPPKADKHRLIYRLLTDPANHRIGQPQQRIIKIHNLQNRLRQIDPQVAPPDMRKLMQ
ncbi:hypothetical protein ES703_98059 [subsurface metagenome]